VPALNTRAAKLQGTVPSDMCTAATALLTGPGGDGSLPLKTTFMLFFEEGHVRSRPFEHLRMRCRPVVRSLVGIFRTYP
jgi:hypothetical protein